MRLKHHSFFERANIYHMEFDANKIFEVPKVTSYKLQVTSYKLQVTSYELQVTSDELQVTSA